MSIAVSAPPTRFLLHRAPPLDPPFADEISPTTYRPVVRPAPPPLPRQALAGASPSCESAAHGFLKVCLELVNGFRSARQLWPLLYPPHALLVLDELVRVQRYANEMRHRGGHGQVHRRSQRVCEPRPGIAEAAAVLSNGDRSWALCYRLEALETLWRCTFLQAALPSPAPRLVSSPRIARQR